MEANTMTKQTINKLKKYLTPDQFNSYIKCSILFSEFKKTRTKETKKAYQAEYNSFLSLTGGKSPAELIPLSIW